MKNFIIPIIIIGVFVFAVINQQFISHNLICKGKWERGSSHDVMYMLIKEYRWYIPWKRKDAEAIYQTKSGISGVIFKIEKIDAFNQYNFFYNGKYNGVYRGMSKVLRVKLGNDVFYSDSCIENN